jgi:hypothetical protein
MAAMQLSRRHREPLPLHADNNSRVPLLQSRPAIRFEPQHFHWPRQRAALADPIQNRDTRINSLYSGKRQAKITRQQI